jgi:hypothetical protein
MSLLDKKVGTPYPHKCPEAFTKALFGDEYKPEAQRPSMKQIRKEITDWSKLWSEPAYAIRDIIILLAVYGFVSLIADVIGLFV